MHEIESLIEYSVKTVATTSPVLSLARDICFSLYKLQDKFDCGYTVLRVQEELKRLGIYIFCHQNYYQKRSRIKPQC